MREAVKKQKKENKARSNRIKFIILVIIFIISMVVLVYKLIEHHSDSEADRNIREELTNIYDEIKDEVPEVKEQTKIEKLEETYLQQVKDIFIDGELF